VHFLDSEKYPEISKTTLLIALVFVITAVIGIGGAAQQICIKFFHFSPSFDLRSKNLLDITIQLGFHVIPFILGIGSLLFVTKKMLLRPISSLFGNKEKALQKFGFSFLIYTCIFLVISILYYWNDDAIQMNFINASFWLMTFVLALFIAIQISFEELLFRAFFPQTLVGLGLSKLSAILLASLLFGILHGNNPEVAVYGKLLIVLYIFHGLFLGIIVYLDNSIWLALGYHFSNNMLTLLFLSSESQVLKTPTLFHLTKEDNNLWWLFVQLIITMSVFFFVCYKKYGWKIKLK
jgi:membrane protease YdiL (CAAX protease family)